MTRTNAQLASCIWRLCRLHRRPHAFLAHAHLRSAPSASARRKSARPHGRDRHSSRHRARRRSAREYTPRVRACAQARVRRSLEVHRAAAPCSVQCDRSHFSFSRHFEQHSSFLPGAHARASIYSTQSYSLLLLLLLLPSASSSRGGDIHAGALLFISVHKSSRRTHSA